MAGYAIGSHTRALIYPRRIAKMRLRAVCQKPPPAPFAGPSMALTDNA
jgi:hypothetical protein